MQGRDSTLRLDLKTVLWLAVMGSISIFFSPAEAVAKSRHSLYQPAAAYKYLYPCRASLDEFLNSLNELQLEVVAFGRVILSYFWIYQRAYYFLSELVLRSVYALYNFCLNLVSPLKSWFLKNLAPSLPLWLATVPKYVYAAIASATVISFFALSNSRLARGVRRVLGRIAYVVCLPPTFFSMDITPIVKGLFSLIKKIVLVLVAFLWFFFNLIYAAAIPLSLALLAAAVWYFLRPGRMPISATESSFSGSIQSRRPNPPESAEIDAGTNPDSQLDINISAVSTSNHTLGPIPPEVSGSIVGSSSSSHGQTTTVTMPRDGRQISGEHNAPSSISNVGLSRRRMASTPTTPSW